MKKRMMAVFLCALLAVAVTACQKTSENTDNISESTMEEETGSTMDVSSVAEEEPVDESGMPEKSESMYEVLMALAVASYDLKSEYAAWNEQYFWTSVAYLVGHTGMSNAAAEDQGNALTLPAEYVKEYANALFAGYDGNAEALPKLPEDFAMVSYDSKNDCYMFDKNDYENMELRLDSCEDNGDGTWQIQVSLCSENGEHGLASYSAVMQETSYHGSGEPVFQYMISVFDMAEMSTGYDGQKIQGAISQDEALEYAEKLYGKNGEADPDTGNIFSYGFEEMTDIDGKTYYNFRVSWLVIDENGQPGHSSYLGNVLVSMDGSMVRECMRDENGNWEIIER